MCLPYVKDFLSTETSNPLSLYSPSVRYRSSLQESRLRVKDKGVVLKGRRYTDEESRGVKMGEMNSPLHDQSTRDQTWRAWREGTLAFILTRFMSWAYGLPRERDR